MKKAQNIAAGTIVLGVVVLALKLAAWWVTAFGVALAAKVALGFALRTAAQGYLRRYARVHGVGGARAGGGLKRD